MATKPRGLLIIGGGGNVTSTAVFADNTILRGDGGGRGIQDSLLSITDAGALQFPAATTSAGGVLLGTDLSLYRSGSSILDINGTSGCAVRIVDTGTVRGSVGSSGSTVIVSSVTGNLVFASNNTTTATLDSSNNATFVGNVICATKTATTTTGNVSALTYRTAENNIGASALSVRTLPTAIAGAEYTFIVDDTDGIQVVANTGDILRIAGNTGTAAGSTTSTTIGSVIRLLAIDATYWDAISVVGTWTNPS